MERKLLALPLLRWGLTLVFFYFGFSQIINPDAWTSYVPSFLSSGSVTANNLVIGNGILEITLGIFLSIGLYTRLSALLLSLHLFGIAASIGFNPVGVRDFGLAIATLVIFLAEEDSFTLDWKVSDGLTSVMGIVK